MKNLVWPVILRSEATKNLSFLGLGEERSFASLRMTAF
jgi:hypothetical protein